MSWQTSCGHAEHFILLTSGKKEWWLLGRLTTQREVTVQTLARLSSEAEALPKKASAWKNVWTSAKSQLGEAAFLFQLTGLRLRVHVWMNGRVCAAALKKEKKNNNARLDIWNQCFNPVREPYPWKATWSGSAIHSWDGEVRGQSVLAKESVCQANSGAGTHRCTARPANDTGEHAASEPDV